MSAQPLYCLVEFVIDEHCFNIKVNRPLAGKPHRQIQPFELEMELATVVGLDITQLRLDDCDVLRFRRLADSTSCTLLVAINTVTAIARYFGEPSYHIQALSYPKESIMRTDIDTMEP